MTSLNNSTNSPPPPTSAPGSHLSQRVNENTPIVGSPRPQHRTYNSTENGLRNRDARNGNGNGLRQTKRRGSRAASRRNSQVNNETTAPRGSWYSRVADRYGSIELENKGSVARDHLALERTFLAWLRTSLAFASIGIAVTQLFRLSNTGSQTTTRGATISGASISAPVLPQFLSTSTPVGITGTSDRLRSIGKPLGTTFIGVAILILLVGFHRYFESQYWIIRGKFPASRGSITLVAFVAVSLIIAALAVILAVSPTAVET